MQNLNQAQLKAVTVLGGPVAIMAGPGTGKTKTLVARIQYLIDHGVQARHILALTFTKKSAEELRTRLQGKPVWAGTFHALCYEILGGDQVFITEPQRLAVIKQLQKPGRMTNRELGLKISRAKNMGDTSVDLEVVKEYNARLADLGVIDFDDLLVKTKQLLTADQEKLKTLKTKFSHILVDEFQDTNDLQYDILRLLVAKNIFVIGDPNQSIYGFRGASGTIFDTFRKDFSDAIEVKLTVNYRSTQDVVHLANAIFSDNLQAANKNKGKVRAVQVLNEFSEANWVLGEIQKAIGGSDLQRAISDDDRAAHRSLRDFAILYRNRSVARIFQQNLEQSGLPFQVVGDGSPYDDAKVQAVIGSLRFLDGDDPPQIVGLSANQAQTILRPIVQPQPINAAEQIIAILSYELTKPLKHLLATLSRFKTLTQANEYFKELAEQQFYDPQAEAITLLTIHASKGLEFPVIFLLGAEEGILPGEKADTQEEKRLFYVAASRAKEQFEATYTTIRHGKPATQSRFIKVLSEDVLEKTQDPQLENDIRKSKKRLIKRAQTSLF